MRRKRTREIAPRLLDGKCRVSVGHGLPPNIKRGLQLIALRENRSLSWVLEQALIPAFGLHVPKYKERKTNLVRFRKRKVA